MSTHFLSFGTLRMANVTRLPLFKNSLGAPAHSKPDGSDWSPAEWFVAVMGELGEAAEVRLSYEGGNLDDEEYKSLISGELPDVQIYLDILALRSLDKLVSYQTPMVSAQGCPLETSPAQCLLAIMASLGTLCNDVKKWRRGDYTYEQTRTLLEEKTNDIRYYLTELEREFMLANGRRESPDNEVAFVHPTGVDLGAATIAKFNATSRKVQAGVYIAHEFPKGHWVSPCWVQQISADAVHAGAGDTKSGLLDGEETL